jgi:hypothetical protein
VLCASSVLFHFDIVVVFQVDVIVIFLFDFALDVVSSLCTAVTCIMWCAENTVQISILSIICADQFT